MRRRLIAAIVCSVGLALGCGGGSKSANSAGKAPSERSIQGSASTPSDPIAAACKNGIVRSCLIAGSSAADAGETTRARSLYGEACELGEALGCLYAGQLWAEGEPVDLEKATTLLTRGCNLGEPTACYGGAIVAAGTFGGEPDLEASAELHRKGCNANLADSCTSLALMLYEGVGVEKNVERATELLEAGCNAEEGGACVELGRIASASGDDEAAAKRFESACDAGDGEGCTLLAALTTDESAKAELFEKGCSAPIPDPTSCTYAAIPDFNGSAPAEAVAVFRESCSSGDAMGCFMHALAAKTGQGMVASESEAERAIAQACELEPERCDTYRARLEERAEE